MMIKNFDVDFEEEQPDLRMLGGIRGIKALRVQRDYLREATKVKQPEPSANRFERYEKIKQGVVQNIIPEMEEPAEELEVV